MTSTPRPVILLVEDDDQVRTVMARALGAHHRVIEADRCAKAIELLHCNVVDVALLDLHLPDGHGLDIIDFIADAQLSTDAIVMTGDGQIDNATSALHRRASDFLLKPFSNDALVAVVERVVRARRPRVASEPPTQPQALALGAWRARYAPRFLGEDPRVVAMFRTVQRICDTDCSVLVTGESGTGKELIARALHTASGRAQGPFITVNCAAIPDSLLESELFGHARGAFTGAVAPRVGRFAAADGGTLFLDEIGELPLSQQAKLLRAVQEREIVPVGETRARKVDVRLVAATHRDLDAMVEEGTFREDLLYRIHVVPVQLPALRERRSDVVALIAHFIQETNRRRNRAVTGVSEDALSVLTAYDWPGNVRQLENMVERMVLLRGSGQIAIEDVPERIVGAAQARLGSSDPLLPEDGIDLRDAVEHYENSLILKALERTGWNRSRAAEVLRMNRTTLVEKLKKKNLDQTAA